MSRLFVAPCILQTELQQEQRRMSLARPALNFRNQKPPKLRHACNECHASKVKCSGERTGCRRCTENGQTCTYSVSMVGKVQSHRRRIRLSKDIPKPPGTSPDTTSVARTPESLFDPKPEHSSPAVKTDTGAGDEKCPGETRAKEGQDNVAAFQMMDFADEIPDDFMMFVNTDYLAPTQSHVNDESWYKGSPRHNSHSSSGGGGAAAFSPRMENHGEQADMLNHSNPPPCHDGIFSPGYQLNHRSQSFSHPPLMETQNRRRYYDDCTSSPTDSDQLARSVSPFSTAAHQNYQRFPHRDTTPQSSNGSGGLFSPCSQIPSTCGSPPSEQSWHSISKTLDVIGRLQKLLLDPSSLSLDVILATNKTALAELDASLSGSTCLSPGQFSATSYFALGKIDVESRTPGFPAAASSDPATQMIYVVALKHIHELYSRACFIFNQDSDESAAISSIPSPPNYNAAASFPPSHRKASSSFGLPRLDFGSFIIDMADQRRMFAEIIARELGNCLNVCQKVRGCFGGQPQMGVPERAGSGVMEETFWGVEEGVSALVKGIMKV